MPRKTGVARDQPMLREHASMRPRPDAAENQRLKENRRVNDEMLQ